MAVKLLVENCRGGTDRCIHQPQVYTDMGGKDFLWEMERIWEEVDAGICANCGKDVTGQHVLVSMDAEAPEFWCPKCIITQSIPQIIQAYEQCREKLDEITDAVGSIIHSLNECINKEVMSDEA